jgi:hypothetical protein
LWGSYSQYGFLGGWGKVDTEYNEVLMSSIERIIDDVGKHLTFSKKLDRRMLVRRIAELKNCVTDLRF